MIKQLTDLFTSAKQFAYQHTALRLGLYLVILVALLLSYLYLDTGEVAFVYNEF